jgi:hypothetical protein
MIEIEKKAEASEVVDLEAPEVDLEEAEAA